MARVTAHTNSNNIVNLSFVSAGVNQWRDSQPPKKILEDYCKKTFGGVLPIFYNTKEAGQNKNQVKVGNKMYSLSDFGKCLNYRLKVIHAEFSLVS